MWCYGEAYLSHERSKSENNFLSMTPNEYTNDGYKVMDQDGECDGMRYWSSQSIPVDEDATSDDDTHERDISNISDDIVKFIGREDLKVVNLEDLRDL